MQNYMLILHFFIFQNLRQCLKVYNKIKIKTQNTSVGKDPYYIKKNHRNWKKKKTIEREVHSIPLAKYTGPLTFLA